MIILDHFLSVRKRTDLLGSFVSAETAVLQPAVFTSPTKWHLAHTSWFFERFVLQEHVDGYVPYNGEFNFLFNSYYNSIGTRQPRHLRGQLSVPTLERIIGYRHHVTDAIMSLLQQEADNEAIARLVAMGIQHEQQHQELLVTDLKYTLGHQPTFPTYAGPINESEHDAAPMQWIDIAGGLLEVGATGNGFAFDNELPRHQQFIHPVSIRSTLVTNAEYLEFMESGAYQDHRLWHMDGWTWVNAESVRSPLYWHAIESQWHEYRLSGFAPLDLAAPVTHVNYYEASAFALWAGATLPTEGLLEHASDQLQWGKRWEWSNSAYLPYPGYRIPDGAVGEYNGKFMVNQMVLKGASVATPEGHSRPSYRNFFYPDQRWQYTGIRLCR